MEGIMKILRLTALCLTIVLMIASLSSAAITIDGEETLTPGTVGQSYSLQLTASGGTEPYRWIAYSLPRGLTLSAEGLLSGTPVAQNVRLRRGSLYATFPISILVVDSDAPQSFVGRVMYMQINCKTSKYWPDVCEITDD